MHHEARERIVAVHPRSSGPQAAQSQFSEGDQSLWELRGRVCRPGHRFAFVEREASSGEALLHDVEPLLGDRGGQDNHHVVEVRENAGRRRQFT